MSKEVIEKITKVATSLRHCELRCEVEPNPEIATAGDRPPDPIIILGASESLAQELDQALALLRAEEPTCKTCGGSGQRPDFNAPTPEGRPFAFKQVHCPDCKEPEASEFTKKARRRITTDRNLISRIEDTDETIPYLVIADEALSRLAQACDRLDRQECDLIDAKAAKVQAENDMCVMRGEISRLKAKLKTKDELLEWAWVDCGWQDDLTSYLEHLEEMNKPNLKEKQDENS